MSWSHTLHLPKPRLANRSNARVVAHNLERVGAPLYRWQAAQAARPAVVLHDGPPYANGALHIGHALNKVLKDFILRYAVLSGNRVEYVPGWDCHGLPIEHAAAKHHREKKRKQGAKMPNGGSIGALSDDDGLSALQRRRLARAWALDFQARQQADFRKWAVLADWDAPGGRYLTLDSAYVARELRVFAGLVAKGLVFRQRKPVFWSVDSGTALAESELVYGERTSQAVFLKYGVDKLDVPGVGGDGRAALAVWTTTPWTLVANRAIAVNPGMDYVVLPHKDGGAGLVVGVDLVPGLVADGVLDAYDHAALDTLPTFRGERLVGATYRSPFDDAAVPLPVVAADHVVNTAGTGLVHTAPGHGKEDFGVGQKHGLEIASPVDGHGRYTADAGFGLAGLDARTAGQQQVLALLRERGAVLAERSITHSVPLDWRTKTPVLVRATPQFFMDLGPRVRGLAVAALADVEFRPLAARQRLQAFTESRADWCISRQRPWGVPIPVLLDRATDEPLLDADAIAHVVDRIAALGDAGLDAWFADEADVEAWLPPALQNQGRGTQFRKSQDTLDVWLDSGASWTMLERPADFYVEGSDQHRGWFQSSLLLHVAMTGRAEAPFKRLVTHGFVLDGQRQKMSKSLGNTVEPAELIAAVGVDGMRLLIAQSDYTADIALNATATQQVAAMVKKFRLTFRYLLGNLEGSAYDLSSEDSTVASITHTLSPQYSDLDVWALARLNELTRGVQAAYAAQNFPAVVKLVQAHMNATLSSVYFDAVKDTLYAAALRDPARVAVQAVLAATLDAYVRLLAPLLPLLTQEVWDVCPPAVAQGRDSPLMAGYPAPTTIAVDGQAADEAAVAASVARVEQALGVRTLVNAAVEEARAAKHVGSSLACDLYIETTDAAVAALDAHLLETVCVASRVVHGPPPAAEWTHTAADAATRVSCVPPSHHKCGRCWKYTAPAADELCAPCEAAVASDHA